MASVHTRALQGGSVHRRALQRASVHRALQRALRDNRWVIEGPLWTWEGLGGHIGGQGDNGNV